MTTVSDETLLAWITTKRAEVWGKMMADHAADWSDAEIERCLRGCVQGIHLVPGAKLLRDAGLAPALTDVYQEA